MLAVHSVEGMTVESADITCSNTIRGLNMIEQKIEEIHQECALCRDRMECITTNLHSRCKAGRDNRIETQKTYFDETAKFILENKDYILKSSGIHWQHKLRVMRLIDA